MRDERRDIEEEDTDNTEVSVESLSEKISAEKSKAVQAETSAPSMKPYKPHVPYPQLAKAKDKQKYGKFLEILKKYHINIPFMESITDMPSYAKFLKDLLSNKEKLLENATVSLTRSAVL